MAFEVGDEVVYDGSLGRHWGSVAVVHADGGVDVRIDSLPEMVRTDEGSLSRWYAEGGPIAPPYATGGVVSAVDAHPSDGGFMHDEVASTASMSGAANEPAAEA